MVIVVDNKNILQRLLVSRLRAVVLNYYFYTTTTIMYILKETSKHWVVLNRKKKKRKKRLSKNTIIKSLDSCRKRHCLKGKFSV